MLTIFDLANIIIKEANMAKSNKKDWHEVLKPYFSKRCVIKNAYTYESGLYFYAFDSVKDKELLKVVKEYMSDSPDYLEDVDPDNVVIFGFATEADFNEEISEKNKKIIAKKGLIGLAKTLAYPSPLLYDKSNGNAYFFPDGSPSPLSKDGEKKITIDKLKISVVKTL
jgi:hypothetical protein